MGTLIRHSTPAERFCKCSLALGFDSSEDVARASGVISGTPTIAGGLATLNGTTGYITYALTGNEFNSAEISIVIEFWPDFDTDENVARMLFDSTTSNRYLCYKQTNANSNVLTIFLGNILIASIAEATYSPFWLVGQRNVLQISGTSTDTSAWLNGNLILDADATAWTAKTPVTFYIGSEHNTFKRFDGKIGPIKVFKGLLTAQDALNFYNKNTYAYRENYAFHLPMRAQEHDPTNTQTLDIQNSNHGAFGAGAAEPTKNSGRGYYYDGGDYLLIADSVDLRIRTNDFAIGVLFKRTTAGTNKALIAKGAAGAGQWELEFGNPSSEIRFFEDGGLINLSWDQGDDSFWDGRYHTVIVSRIDAVISMYIDGYLRASSAGVGTVDMDATDDISIGAATEGSSNWFTGDILDVIFLPSEGMTALRAADLHIRTMKSINQV